MSEESMIAMKPLREEMKTIIDKTHENFDKQVNEALSEGWFVSQYSTEVISDIFGNSMIYIAFMRRYVEVDDETTT